MESRKDCNRIFLVGLCWLFILAFFSIGNWVDNEVMASDTSRLPFDHSKIPLSPNPEWKEVCMDESLNLVGDFQSSKSAVFIAEGQWSVDLALSTQLFKYDFGTKQAGFNTSLGLGAAFRFYPTIEVKDQNGVVVDRVRVSFVKPECRQSTIGRNSKGYLASSLFSITPTIFVAAPANQEDVAIQPALLVGFFEDLVSVGVGVNLHNTSREKGNVFMLMSLGAGIPISEYLERLSMHLKNIF